MIDPDPRPSAHIDQAGQTIHGDQINAAHDNIIQPHLDPAAIRNQRNHAVLRQKVYSFWIEGVLQHSLYSEVLIRLNVAQRTDLVNNQPWDLILRRPDLDDEPLAPGVPIVDLFDQFGQRLLILGEPGSGKTTTLLELTAALLTRAAQDPTQPTPVVFNLSSWAADRKPLIAWLINELHEKYTIPKRLAQSWLEQEELLPLLDGLDEVPADQQAACVTAINQFRQDHLLPLAVCCRLAEYEATPQPLTLDGAIQIQPLQEAQVNDYLSRINLATPDNQSPQQEQSKLLGDWLRPPLMLSIIALTYGGAEAHTVIRAIGNPVPPTDL
ncbi:MAG: NACHT domain-containing protein [Caldilineaceae bacterium]